MPNSDEESVSTLPSLERTKRRIIRSLASLKAETDAAFASQNQSEDLADKIGALIEETRILLRELEVVTDRVLDATDMIKLTPTQCSTLEEQECAELVKYQLYLADARGKLRSLLNRLKPSVPVTARQSLDTSFMADAIPNNPFVKLPAIPVPKFDGKMKNFIEWHSLFAATIDSNEKLKPVQKLYYLKQAMTGEAENLLKDYALEERLYDPAYEYVKERYFNKRVIISNHFRDLLDLTPITLASLRESLDRVSASIRGLKVCDMNTEHMSPFISYIVARKLPEKLRTDWENSNLDYSTYPCYNLLETFLHNRCRSYESIRSESSSAPLKPDDERKLEPEAYDNTSSLATAVSKPRAYTLPPKCVLCEQGHYLSNCNEFLQKSVSDRFAFVKDNKLCTNCLHKGHYVIECISSPCRKCSENHNTLLHREVSFSLSTEKQR